MKIYDLLVEFKKGIKAVKHNKKAKDPAKQFAKAKEKLEPIKPMEGAMPPRPIPLSSKGVEEGVAEGKEDKIKQLRQDYATAVHWSKNEKSPQKREAARQKAEKIKRHLETQYKQGVAEAQLDETPTIDFIRGLISDFNKQMSGSPYYPMDYKNPGMRMWTRGDGSKYKDPGYIFIERDLKPEDQPKWRKAGAVEKFWKFLESKGARKIGDVSGEFGSDPHSPAVVLNKLIFVFNGGSIAWGSTSRLKNSNVWRQKQQGVAEGLSDTQKKIEDTILKLEQRLKFAKTPEQWDNIKNRIERLQAGLNRSKQGVAEGSLEEYGDTAKGQKMLTKVQKRAVDRMIKAADKNDAKNAKKNQDTANRAWDRMDTSEEIGYDDVSPKSASYILRKMEQGVPMSDILDDFPELSRMIDVISGEYGLHPDDDFEEIENILMNDLEDIAAQDDDFGDYDQDEEDNMKENKLTIMGALMQEGNWGRRSYGYNPDRDAERAWDAAKRSEQDFRNRERNAGLEDEEEYYQRQVAQQREKDRGPWYLKINGKILKSRGEVKVFDWKSGAVKYGQAILKNRPELDGKIFLTKKNQDDPGEIAETASPGATSAGNVATLGMNPKLSPGPARGKKSYTGSPGKSGTKAPPQPKVIQPKGKGGTAKNALDMKSNIFGGGAVKRK